MANSYREGQTVLEQNWVVDENGDLYNSGNFIRGWYEGGSVDGYSELPDKGTPILHVTPEQLLTVGTNTYTKRFVLQNGNYWDITYTIYGHNDGVANVFDRIDWDITGYDKDGNRTSVDTSGTHSTATLKHGQYQAWLMSGADLTFMMSQYWDEAGNPTYEGDPTNYNYQYGAAFVPSHYSEGVRYPIGGTFNEVLPIGCNIDMAYSGFDACPDPNNMDKDSVPSTRFIEMLDGATEEMEKETPGEDTDAGEDGRPGGGGGTGYMHEDNGIPSLPTISAADLCNIYHITGTQLRQFTSYMWDNNFFTSIVKNQASPAENIVMLGIVPWSNFSQTASEIQIGNVNTQINAPRLTTTYYELNCGAITVGEPTNGTFADYEPYTRYWIFLPYIGMVDLPADDVALNGQVTVIYHFDVFSGACVAFVRCFTPKGWFTLGEYNGNLLTNVPVSGTNFLSMYMGVAKSLVGAASAAASGNYVGAGVDLAAGLMTSKPEYMRSGSISSSAGLLGHQRPFLVRAVPEMARTTHFRTMQGYASKLEGTIGSHTGYLRTQYTNLSGVSGATDEELAEIKQLLESGIYV